MTDFEFDRLLQNVGRDVVGCCRMLSDVIRRLRCCLHLADLSSHSILLQFLRGLESLTTTMAGRLQKDACLTVRLGPVVLRSRLSIALRLSQLKWEMKPVLQRIRWRSLDQKSEKKVMKSLKRYKQIKFLGNEPECQQTSGDSVVWVPLSKCKNIFH